MHHNTFRKIVFAVGALAFVSLAVLWSFNTLSELFGGPEAQYKHAISAFGMLLLLKWTLTRLGRGHLQNQIGRERHRLVRGNPHEH